MQKLDAIASKTKTFRCKIIQCGGRCLRPGEVCRLLTTPKQKEIFKSASKKVRLSSNNKTLIAGALGLAAGVGLAAVASRSSAATTSENIAESTIESNKADFSPVNNKVKVNQAELDKQREKLIKEYGRETVEAAELNTQKILTNPDNDAYVRVPSIDRLESITDEGFLSGAQLAKKGINRFNQNARDQVEKKVMGITSANTPDEERPIYAYLGESDKQNGLAHKFMDDSIYGTINVKLKAGVKNRSTFTGSDSFSSGIASPVTTNDGSPPNAASLARLTFRGQDDNPDKLTGYAKKAYIPDPSDNKTRLEKAAKAKTPGELAKALNGRSGDDPAYVEVQVQGGVKSTDISEIHFNPKYNPDDPNSFDDRPSAKVAQWAKDNEVKLFVKGKRINPDDLLPPPPTPPTGGGKRKQKKSGGSSPATQRTVSSPKKTSTSASAAFSQQETSSVQSESAVRTGQENNPDTTQETVPKPLTTPSPKREVVTMKAELVPQGMSVVKERASRRPKSLLPASVAQKLLPAAAITATTVAAAKSNSLPGITEEAQKLLPPSASKSNSEKKAEVEVKKAREQTRKLISESRDLKSKRKRMETELQKAVDKIELGQKLQKKESDVDKLRGVDYEMIASEKRANLEAKIAEIKSREERIGELLSPKPPVQINFTPLSGEGTITPVPKGIQVIEERQARKKNNAKKRVNATSEQPKKPQEPSPVQSEETVTNKKKKRSIVQRVANVFSRKNKDPLATQGEEGKETPKERRRRERAEDKQLKKELIEQTGKSASKAMVRNTYKTPLNLVVPGLGDAVESADKFFADKSRLEKWAQELEDSGDINVSRREFFRGGKRFIAKQTVAKPKGITQELRRGAEISKDFFEKLVGGNSDELILKGAKNRGFGADRGRRIQLTKQEYERITATYTNPQKRQLLNFLQYIGFPIP